MLKRGRLTRKIRILYTENMYVRLNRYNKLKMRYAVHLLMEEATLRFRAAAHQCARLAADPMDYVSATFEVFDHVSFAKNKTILPQPGHLVGPNAEERWRNRDTRARVVTMAMEISKMRRTTAWSDGNIFDPEAQCKAYDLEERKLANLIRATRLPEEEVLSRFPAEFSSGFAASRAA